MATGDDLVALLGKASDDPLVLDALKQFAIRWPPELDEPPEDRDEERNWYVWRPSSAQGFEFGFQDEAHLRALAPTARGQSPLVLSSVCFYGEHDGVQPFQGVLPFGLAPGDSRAVVRAKLSALDVPPRSHRRDTWDPPPHRIVAEHVPGRDVLDSLLVKLRLEDWPWPPLDEPAPTLPTVSEILALFGLPWHAPEMRRIFFPLGLDACGPDIARHRNADLRRSRGLELYFFRDPARAADNPLKNKGAAFCAFKFYRSRYQDARGWAGELPLGLTFDESFPGVMRKIGRKPDEANDGKLSGYALWNFADYTLHVLYDNVDNVVNCFSLFEPGAWK